MADLSYHRLRKSIHLACFLVFAALPFFDVMRFDIPRQRFYLAGRELWINEFGIVFFSLMFLMFVVVAVSIMYGRLYCGYLCPQTIFSEASLWWEQRTRKWARRSKLRARLMFWSGAAAGSIFLAFVFISYFVEPRDLLRRRLSLDVQTAGGVAGAAVTLIALLDFTLVRLRFCTTVCPYGYLQGMLADGNTLLVEYRDPDKACIDCGKCVRVCPMGIDIRDSAHQMECVHCGECIDACKQILGRLNQPGLVHYSWGEGARTGPQPWHRRLGLRDAKRVVVMLVILFYAAGLFAALAVRRPVLTQISPVRAQKLYEFDSAGRVLNRFRLRAANRGGETVRLALATEGLPGAVVAFDPLLLAPGQSIDREFTIRAGAPAEVNHFHIVAAGERIPMTFLMPPAR